MEYKYLAISSLGDDGHASLQEESSHLAMARLATVKYKVVWCCDQLLAQLLKGVESMQH